MTIDRKKTPEQLTSPEQNKMALLRQLMLHEDPYEGWHKIWSKLLEWFPEVPTAEVTTIQEDASQLLANTLEIPHLGKSFSLLSDEQEEIISYLTPHFAERSENHVPRRIIEKLEGRYKAAKPLTQGEIMTILLSNTIDLSDSGYGFNPEHFQYICSHSFLEHIEELNLNRCHSLGHRAGEILAETQSFPHLKELNLAQVDLGNEGLAALAQAEHLKEVTSLWLNNNHIGVEGMEALAASQAFPELQHLLLSGNYIGRDGVKALQSASGFPELKGLAITSSALEWPSIRALAQVKTFPKLEFLLLQGNNLNDSAMRALQKAEFFPALTRISLGGNTKITEKGAKVFAKIPHFPHLEVLDLVGTRVGLKGLRAILKSKNFPNLKEINAWWIDTEEDEKLKSKIKAMAAEKGVEVYLERRER